MTPALEPLSGGRFLVIGRAGLDLYADPPGARTEEAFRFTSALGGSSANISVALVRQGQKADLLTCLSDDAVGRYCLAALDGYGVGRHHVRLVSGDARTSLGIVETRLENCQSVIYRNNAADFAMSDTDVDRVDYQLYSALVLTGTALASEPSRGACFRALELASGAGLTLIFDIDYRPYSWPSADMAEATYSRAAALCDIVIGNDVEFGFMAGDFNKGLRKAEDLAREKDAVAIYKMGDKGSITFAQDRRFRSGIFEIEALKPTGAGDGFLGGFVAGLAQGHSLEDAVRRGSATAAIVVSRVGCAPAMPTTDELVAFLGERSLQPAN